MLTIFLDAQVKTILSKSQFSMENLEQVRSSPEDLEADGLPTGEWTVLEVFVALHNLQKMEGLQLDEIVEQSAGTYVTSEKKIRRRLSYAQAGLANVRSHPSNSPQVPAELAASLSRTQSLIQISSADSLQLRHTHIVVRRTHGKNGQESTTSIDI